VGEAEGEDFGEGVEEDQGLASRGKPFTLTPRLSMFLVEIFLFFPLLILCVFRLNNSLL
jgi:hypothetical protein